LLDKSILDRYRFDAEGLAKEFSKNYFSSHERQFPINPFQVLSELTVPFVFRNLKGILKLKKTQFVLVPSKDKGKPGFDKHDCKEKCRPENSGLQCMTLSYAIFPVCLSHMTSSWMVSR